MAIFYEWGEVVLFHDVWWDILDWDAYVFETFHGRSQVKILDVNCHVFRARGGDDAVDEDFDGGEVGCRCADIPVIDDSVAAHGETNALGLGLVGSEGCDNSKVSGDAVGRFVVVLDEE